MVAAGRAAAGRAAAAGRGRGRRGRLLERTLLLMALGLVILGASLYYTWARDFTASSRALHPSVLDLEVDFGKVKVNTTAPAPGPAGGAEGGRGAGAAGGEPAGAGGAVGTTLSTPIAPLRCNKTTFPAARQMSSAPSGPTFMDIAGGGRLGNTMFEYAALVATAARLGSRPIRPTGPIANTFQLTSVKNVKMERVAVFGESLFSAYDRCIERLPSGYNWTLSGYFQSWRYFHKHAELVRSEFKFKDNIQTEAAKIVHDLGSSSRVKVGVHVRRGDMTLSKHAKMGYTVVDENYVIRAMDYFRKRLEKPLFVVLSDAMTWCRSKFKAEDVVFVNRSPGVDLAVMTLCNHSVVSTGTFGWWGAWLAGGQAVYFSKFPRQGSWMAGQFVAADYFPPHWVPLE